MGAIYLPNRSDVCLLKKATTLFHLYGGKRDLTQNNGSLTRSASMALPTTYSAQVSKNVGQADSCQIRYMYGAQP